MGPLGVVGRKPRVGDLPHLGSTPIRANSEARSSCGVRSQDKLDVFVVGTDNRVYVRRDTIGKLELEPPFIEAQLTLFQLPQGAVEGAMLEGEANRFR